jgi:hypothetical protein
MRFCIDRLGGFEFGYIRESVHKGESLMASAVIDNLVDERRWEVVF